MASMLVLHQVRTPAGTSPSRGPQAGGRERGACGALSRPNLSTKAQLGSAPDQAQMSEFPNVAGHSCWISGLVEASSGGPASSMDLLLIGATAC